MTKEAKIHKKKLEVEAMKVIFKHKDTLYWNFDFDKFKKGIVKLFEEFKGKSL